MSKRSRRLSASLTALVGASLLLAGCGSSSSSSSTSEAAAPNTAAASAAAPSAETPSSPAPAADTDRTLDGVDPLIDAPATAELFQPDDSSAPVTFPTSGEQGILPYANVLPVPDGPIGDPNKTYKFCFSQALTGSTWAVAQADSVAIEAARHPNVEVLYYNTNNDPLKQVADLETCLAQNVDAVLVWPHSVAPLTPEIEKIKASGVPIIGMERTVGTRNYDSWIYLDNKAALYGLAAAVCEQLGGSGTVAETDGAIGSSPQILRRAWFAKGIAEQCPDVKIVDTAPTDYSRAAGYKSATDFLQSDAGKDIDAWFSHYTEIGFGVDQALKDAGLSIPQYSIVDGKNAVKAVQDGVFAAVAPWTPVHGDVALRDAILQVTGQPFPKDLLLVQPGVITKENADEQIQTTWPG